MNRASFYKRIQKPSVFNRHNRWLGKVHRMSGTTSLTNKETAIWIGVSDSDKRMFKNESL